MNDWLENFSFAGIKLTEGEKSLMRFAMSKERERIIKLLEAWECGNDRCYCTFYSAPDRHCGTALELIALIKGEAE